MFSWGQHFQQHKRTTVVTEGGCNKKEQVDVSYG